MRTRRKAISAVFGMWLKASLVLLAVGCSSSQVSIGEQYGDASAGGSSGRTSPRGGASNIGGSSAAGGHAGSAGEPWIRATLGGNTGEASAPGGSAIVGGGIAGGSSGSGSGGGAGALCGGIAGLKCPSGQFCEYAGACKAPFPDATGACVVRPNVCPQNSAPVCGCDGLTYRNDCERSMAGVSKGSDGECAKADGGVSDAASSEAALCTATGGEVQPISCCLNTGDFPDTCKSGACGCSLASSHSVSFCQCPTGGCFLPGSGCVGAEGTCTGGADQTCNDNPSISSVHGHCLTDGRCVCNQGFALLASGKCQ